MANLAINIADNDSFKDAIKALEVAWDGEQERKQEHANVLLSDDAMHAWAERNFHDLVITRRKTYGSKQLHLYQEFYTFGWLEDPRRPVVMKGSKHCLYRQYSLSPYGDSPNGWCKHILTRWAKKNKYTACSYEDYEQSGMPEAKRKLQRKHYANGRGWEYDFIPRPKEIVWINGNIYYGLTGHQLIYLRKIWRISQGIEKLERKRKLYGVLP